MRRLSVILRIFAGGVFAVSGYLKLIEPTQNFLAAVQGYQVVSGPPALWAAQAIPWMEFIFGVFLILGLWARLSLLVLWVLNAVFIAVLGSAVWRKLPLGDCGCFGDNLPMTVSQTLYLDLALFLVFAWLVRREISRGKS